MYINLMTEEVLLRKSTQKSLGYTTEWFQQQSSVD